MLVLIKCIIIGIFAIFPGISGSSLAISMNIYDRILLSFRDIQNNIFFLLLAIIGLLLGVFLGSNIIILFTNYMNVLYFMFIGFIISDIPFMIKNVKKRGNILYFPLILSIILPSLTFITYDSFSENINFFKMVLGGILFSFGKIFPGVSSSFFLVILGIYRKIIYLFSNPLIFFDDIFYYLPFVIGVFIGFIIFIKIYNYLLINKYNLLYSILIGFMISSSISILFKINYNFYCIIGIPLMLICFYISLKFKLKKEI